ncbi:MAG: hypothetical protein QOK42_2618 [Frankiaceae bacterium]|nr:hypothetical protein [Frankiaceae bacterium]
MQRLTASARRRVALLALPVVLATAPVMLANASQPIGCRAASTAGLHWQKTRLPVSDPTGYALDYLQPNRMIVSSAKTIYVSDDRGCSWVTAVQLDTLAQDAGYSSASSNIIDVAFNFNGRAIATVSEGVGAQAVPHVISSRNGLRGTWTTTDSGLPSVGEPRTLAAGLVGFVIGMAQFGSDVTGGIGGLPGGGPTDPTGQVPALFYRSGDGATWTAGATSADLGGAQAITQIAADRFGASNVAAVAAGKVWYSYDRGATFRRSSVASTPSAIVPTLGNGLGIFGSGFAGISSDFGRSYAGIRAVSDVRAGAWRSTDANFMLAGSSHVHQVTLRGVSHDVTPIGYSGSTPVVRSETFGGDAYYIAAGRYLYRWFDSYNPGKQPPGFDNTRVAYKPLPGSISPRTVNLTLRPGGTRTVNYRLHLPKNATPIDVYYLIDVSASMGDVIDDLKHNAKAIGIDLKRDGIDVNEGVGAIGTAPYTRIGEAPDPPTNPGECRAGQTNFCTSKPYHQPVLYRQWAPVGRVNSNFFKAVDRLQEEYYLQPDAPCDVDTHPDANECDKHIEGQLIGLQQSVTGYGVNNIELTNPVLPGQAAGFRQDGNARRVIVLATNERFRMPPGTPVKNGKPDIAGVAALLRQHGIQVLGLTGNDPVSRTDLRQMAKLTGAVAPAGGLKCDYGDYGKVIPAGQPVVCENQDGFSRVIERLLASLTDLQDVQLTPSKTSPVFRGATVSGFKRVNVKAPFDGTFSVTYSCAGVNPGSYPVALDAYLRGYKVASTVATITCGISVVPPITKTDPIPVTQNPPGQPPPPPPAPLPAQPVTQAQAQPQVQINPQVGGAAQEQEQLQLALAQIGIFMVDDDEEKVTQQAMSARQVDERVALALLAAAMASTSIAGLAMMRRHRAQLAARPEPAWIRRR